MPSGVEEWIGRLPVLAGKELRPKKRDPKMLDMAGIKCISILSP